MWVNGVDRPSRTREPTPASNALGLMPAPTAAGPFFGNVRSRVYHAKTCRNATCRNCTREFKTQVEAEAAGFRPAGDCVGRR